MGESYTGHDAQLERAVQELHNQLRGRERGRGASDNSLKWGQTPTHRFLARQGNDALSLTPSHDST